MQLAIVLGSARATVKHASFAGQKLSVVQPITESGSKDGTPLIAIDQLGSRKGDRVLLTSDGSYSRDVTGHENTPARWTVMGIIDETE